MPVDNYDEDMWLHYVALLWVHVTRRDTVLPVHKMWWWEARRLAGDGVLG